jgi:predicted glycosyltransferase
MMRRPPLMFYCQHSLGLGHLSRSFALCKALTRTFDVVLLCGGKLPELIKPPHGVQVISLPPIGAAIDGHLISHDRRFSLEYASTVRRRTILNTFRSLRPEALVIEFFPFGKKRFTDELVPLLEEANNSGPTAPVIVSSIRDILVGRGSEQEEFDDRASELANRYFDVVLVHSDPQFTRLDESFKPRVPLRIPLRYTGFVSSNGHPVHRTAHPRHGVVVSAGGGVAGAPLLNAAISAHRLLEGDLEMTVITGPFLPEDEWQSLKAKANGRRGLTLLRSVPDLDAVLQTARASVSQCGYNTSLEILMSGIPSLVVPFADGGEDEQTKRAHRLQGLGAVRVLESSGLEPEKLAAEIHALLRFRPKKLQFDFEGGANSARILNGLHARRFEGRAS